jgi:hypothetical protein
MEEEDGISGVNYMLYYYYVLRHIFNINLSQGKYPILWKQAVVVPAYKKGNNAIINKFRLITVLNNFSKIFESIIHNQLSFYCKYKLHPS